MSGGFEASGYLKRVLGEDERILFATRKHGLFFARSIGWAVNPRKRNERYNWSATF